MQFNMWRDYLGSSKLLEAMKKECVERAQLPQPKPVTHADVWHFPWLQCLEDQQNALPSTPRNIVSPKIRDPDVMRRAPLHAPLTQLDNWTFAIPNSCGLDGQKNARLNTPSPLKTQMDSKDFLYFPTRWSADKEMTSLHTSRSQMDALDFTSSQACGPEMQKRDPLGRPRIQVDNINTSHPPSWWSKFQEETLRFSPIPKVDITQFPPANSSLSVGEEAAPALEERAKRNTADSKATTSWWNNCSCRLLGHNAPVGASDEAPRHLWGSDSQERASLHRSRSEVGSLESASNLWGSDSQERASLHRSRSEVGSLESTSNLWGSDSQERASLHRSRSEVGSLESASNLWRVDNNTAQHTTSAKGGAFGFAPPHQWGFKGQQDDSLRPSRIEVSARDFSLPHPWWPVVQKGSQRRTPSPEMYASDVAAPHVKMPKDWEEVLLPASGTKRAATDSQLQHFSGLEQQKNFSQRISQDDFQASEVISPQADATKASIWCAFCKHNGESKHIYCSHSLKDSEGHVQCPVLRNYVCPQCQATGDDAHTRRFCPRTEKGYASVYQYPTRNASGKRNQKLLSLVPKN